MRLKLIVATLVALAGFDIADPPNVLTETVCMTQQQPAIGVPAVRTAPPKTRQVEVSLDDIVVDLERYCHRDKKSLEPEAYEPLKNSILQEGLRHPIEVFRRPDGTYGVVTGHRRYYVVSDLAKLGIGGYAKGMKIPVIELLDTTEADRLGWSVADNETRLNLSPRERLGVVKKFVTAGMTDEVGANRLGYSVKQYKRDRTLVDSDWMFDLHDRHNIPATTCVQLLEAAAKSDRMMELKTHMTDWVAECELDLETEKAQGGTIDPGKLIANRLTPGLRKRWLDCLKSNLDLDNLVGELIDVKLDPDAMVATVGSTKIDFYSLPPKILARFLSDLTRICETGIMVVKSRVAIEGAEGPQAQLRKEGDLSQSYKQYLRDQGLDELDDTPPPAPFSPIGNAPPATK